MNQADRNSGPVVVLAYQEIGYVCLESLIQAGANIALVLTHEDDAGEEIWFRSVAGLAAKNGIPVLKPEDPNTPEVAGRIREIAPDFILSFYYRHMLSPALLNAARVGAYNLHGSLLPKYRGRAPVNWVLVNGESVTGVTLHRMVRKPDAGPVVAQRSVPVSEADDVRTLYRKMTAAARVLMDEAWPMLISGCFQETPQQENQASYFGGRKPADGRIDWNRPAKKIYDLVRAVTHPYPGAFTLFKGRKLFIWEASYELPVSLIEDWQQEPGTVIHYDDDEGLAVATGQGRLFIKRASWENQDEFSGRNLAGLGLASGEKLEHAGERIPRSLLRG